MHRSLWHTCKNEVFLKPRVRVQGSCLRKFLRRGLLIWGRPGEGVKWIVQILGERYCMGEKFSMRHKYGLISNHLFEIKRSPKWSGHDWERIHCLFKVKQIHQWFVYPCKSCSFFITKIIFVCSFCFQVLQFYYFNKTKYIVQAWKCKLQTKPISIITQVIKEILTVSLVENDVIFNYNHLQRGDYSGRTNFQHSRLAFCRCVWRNN